LVDEAAAFDMPREQSRSTNRKLVDIPPRSWTATVYCRRRRPTAAAFDARAASDRPPPTRPERVEPMSKAPTHAPEDVEVQGPLEPGLVSKWPAALNEVFPRSSRDGSDHRRRTLGADERPAYWNWSAITQAM